MFWHNRKLTLENESKDIYFEFAVEKPSSSVESYISEHNSSSSECSYITRGFQDIQELNTAEKQSYNKLNKKNKIDDMFWNNSKLTCEDESKEIYYEFAVEKPSSSDESYISEHNSSHPNVLISRVAYKTFKNYMQQKNSLTIN